MLSLILLCDGASSNDVMMRFLLKLVRSFGLTGFVVHAELCWCHKVCVAKKRAPLALLKTKHLSSFARLTRTAMFKMKL